MKIIKINAPDMRRSKCMNCYEVTDVGVSICATCMDRVYDTSSEAEKELIAAIKQVLDHDPNYTRLSDALRGFLK